MGDNSLENETDSVMEMLLVGLFCILGFSMITAMIVSFNLRLNSYERFDKISASVLYEDAAEHTYKFTPYQAYMLGYNIDPWGPEGVGVTWFASNSNNVTISVPAYHKDLVTRNNMISGANGVNPSVRSVLDSINPNYSMENWYRNGTLYLKWTDSRSQSYNEMMDDALTVIEYGKRDFKWILEK